MADDQAAMATGASRGIGSVVAGRSGGDQLS